MGSRPRHRAGPTALKSSRSLSSLSVPMAARRCCCCEFILASSSAAAATCGTGADRQQRGRPLRGPPRRLGRERRARWPLRSAPAGATFLLPPARGPGGKRGLPRRAVGLPQNRHVAPPVRDPSARGGAWPCPAHAPRPSPARRGASSAGEGLVGPLSRAAAKKPRQRGDATETGPVAGKGRGGAVLPHAAEAKSAPRGGCRAPCQARGLPWCSRIEGPNLFRSCRAPRPPRPHYALIPAWSDRGEGRRRPSGWTSWAPQRGPAPALPRLRRPPRPRALRGPPRRPGQPRGGVPVSTDALRPRAGNKEQPRRFAFQRAGASQVGRTGSCRLRSSY